MTRLELLMNDGYWKAAIDLILQSGGKGKYRRVLKEVLSMKNELTALLKSTESIVTMCPKCGKVKDFNEACECVKAYSFQGSGTTADSNTVCCMYVEDKSHPMTCVNCGKTIWNHPIL